MKDKCNLDYIINRYKTTPSELEDIIELRKINFQKSGKLINEDVFNCDINILVSALDIIKKDNKKLFLLHSVPIIISIYFIFSEIYYLDLNLASIQSDIYLNNVDSLIYLIKVFIAFFIIPIMLIERLINNTLRLDTKFFPYKLFYNLLYLLIAILVIIRVYEVG